MTTPSALQASASPKESSARGVERQRPVRGKPGALHRPQRSRRLGEARRCRRRVRRSGNFPPLPHPGSRPLSPHPANSPLTCTALLPSGAERTADERGGLTQRRSPDGPLGPRAAQHSMDVQRAADAAAPAPPAADAAAGRREQPLAQSPRERGPLMDRKFDMLERGGDRERASGPRARATQSERRGEKRRSAGRRQGLRPCDDRPAQGNDPSRWWSKPLACS